MVEWSLLQTQNGGKHQMKKLEICIGVLGLIILIKVLLAAKDKKAASTNIIGDANGSTTIYLAGKYRR
jgi:Na+-transporting methylmalonyl-CoA/oxaloacetate decarboxylase beta subunit